jgi:hypothetical protein
MYEKPRMERLGTLRELTLGGGVALTDPFISNQGCEGTPQGPITCHTPS